MRSSHPFLLLAERRASKDPMKSTGVYIQTNRLFADKEMQSTTTMSCVANKKDKEILTKTCLNPALNKRLDSTKTGQRNRAQMLVYSAELLKT